MTWDRDSEIQCGRGCWAKARVWVPEPFSAVNTPQPVALQRLARPRTPPSPPTVTGTGVFHSTSEWSPLGSHKDGQQPLKSRRGPPDTVGKTAFRTRSSFLPRAPLSPPGPCSLHRFSSCGCPAGGPPPPGTRVCQALGNSFQYVNENGNCSQIPTVSNVVLFIM